MISTKTKLSCICLLIYCFSFSVESKKDETTFHLSANTELFIQNRIEDYCGLLERDVGAIISGAGIAFTEGTFRDGGKKIKLTALMEADLGNYIKLEGSKTFKGSGSILSYDLLVSGSDNRIEGELLLLNDIELQDVDTTVTLALTRRLNQNINLNNGKIYLEENLSFIDGKKIVGPGTVVLNKRKLILGSEVLTWDTPIYFDHGNDIELHANLYLDEIWTFSGSDNSINGNGVTIFLEDLGNIIVERGSSLLLHNIKFEGVGGDNICCLDNAATLSIQNVVFWLDEDYTFSLGSLQLQGNLDLHGAHTFAYQSVMTSTILKNSSLILDRGITFSYDPLVYRKDLLCFEDSSSLFYLNGTTLHITRTGMKLTKGTGIIDGNSVIYAEALDGTGDISFGAQDADYDFSMNILHGSMLTLSQGQFYFKNVDADSWGMDCATSAIRLQANSSLTLSESMNLGDGRLFLSQQASLVRPLDKAFDGSVSMTS